MCTRLLLILWSQTGAESAMSVRIEEEVECMSFMFAVGTSCSVACCGINNITADTVVGWLVVTKCGLALQASHAIFVEPACKDGAMVQSSSALHCTTLLQPLLSTEAGCVLAVQLLHSVVIAWVEFAEIPLAKSQSNGCRYCTFIGDACTGTELAQHHVR